MSEVKDRSATPHVRRVVVKPQPLLARLCQNAVTWITLAIAGGAALLWGGTPPWASQFIHVSVWLAGFLWVLRLVLLRRSELVVNSLSAPGVLLVSYAIVRYGLAEVEPVARPEMMLAVTAGLLFFLSVNNTAHRSHVSLLVSVTGTVAAGLSLLAVWQALVSHSKADSGLGNFILQQGDDGVTVTLQKSHFVWGQAAAVLSRPGQLAGFLGLVFPMLAAFFFFSRWSYRAKVYLLVLLLVVAGGMIVTQSLGGLLGLLASVVVLGQYLLRRRNIRMRWVIVGGTVWFVLALAVMGVLQVYGTPSAESSLLPVWRAAFAMARQNFLLGTGPGMFPWLYPDYRAAQVTPDSIHNEYLRALTTYGLSGLVLVGWLLVMYVRSCVQILGARAERYSVNTASNRYAFVVGALGAAVAISVHALVGSPLESPANICLLAIIVATSLTCGVHPSGKWDDEMDDPGLRQTIPVKGFLKWALVISLLFLLGLQASRLRKSAPAEWLLVRADQYRADLDWAAAETAYRRAWAFDARSYRIPLAVGDFFLARATWDQPERVNFAQTALRWFDRAYTRNPYATEALKIGRAHV